MHGTYLQNRKSMLKYMKANPEKRRGYNAKYARWNKIKFIFLNILL